ncbi:MAG: hypothetical protein LBH43_04145 [Treponema sp.]|nr:hypothetical protein [Treponema sp.]
MNNITDFTESTSEYELFAFLSQKVINRDITVFSKLKEFAEPILRNHRSHPVMMDVFTLIRKLYWGFFADMTPETHKKLWTEMVVPDHHFPKAGDLKTTLQVSNLYVVMVDIHGYTQFCMDSRKNLSMAHALDEAMDVEVRKLSALCHALSRRERGDEMVIVAASASDALTLTLAIIDYFGKSNILDDPNICTKRSGRCEALPVFKLSAGITGNFGSIQTPMITTEQGNLAGFLLNSGARLQTRANELSGKETRLMIARQVYMSYMKENEKEKCPLFEKDLIYFLDTGKVEFKGVDIATCEAVFKSEDMYKEKFSEELTTLFNSIKEKNWEQKIFSDLMDLMIKTAQVMPSFTVVPASPINGMQTLTNASFIQLCRLANKAYVIEEDYSGAMGYLQILEGLIEEIPKFDKLILDYLKGVMDKYDMLLKQYLDSIDKEIDSRAAQIFQGDYHRAWLASKNAITVYEKLKALGRKSNEISKKKTLWYSLIKQNSDKMDFVLHSGKK